MPDGNGKMAEKTKWHSLEVLSAIKKSVVFVKAALNCLAYALINAMARINGDPKHKTYRDGYSLKKPVEGLLKASRINLSNGGGFEELRQFQEQLLYYTIIVWWLNPGRVIYSRNSLLVKELYLLYDRNCVHCNVITNHKGAMARKYVSNGCDILYDFTHKCDKVCSLCTATPRSTKDQTKHCGTCNRQWE